MLYPQYNYLTGLSTGHSTSPELKESVTGKKQLSLDDANDISDEIRPQKLEILSPSKASYTALPKTSSPSKINSELSSKSRPKVLEDRSKNLFYCPDLDRVEQKIFPPHLTKSVEIYSESQSMALDSVGDANNAGILHRSISQDSAPLNLKGKEEMKPKYSGRALFLQKHAVSVINVHFM